MDNIEVIPQAGIISRIIVIRGEKVILDMHLAEIYEVETRALKQAVRRNIDLFPDDFLFQLTREETEMMVSHSVIPSFQSLGGSFPFAFTEAGVAMLSGILKSKRAKQMNIYIMRAFVALRKIILDNSELRLEIENIKVKVGNQEKNIELVFQYLDELLRNKEEPEQDRKLIGFQILSKPIP